MNVVPLALRTQLMDQSEFSDPSFVFLVRVCTVYMKRTCANIVELYQNFSF